MTESIKIGVASSQFIEIFDQSNRIESIEEVFEKDKRKSSLKFRVDLIIESTKYLLNNPIERKKISSGIWSESWNVVSFYQLLTDALLTSDAYRKSDAMNKIK